MARPKAASFDVQRGAIRDAAARLFADKGYASASIADIASACGISKALLYHYYRDKEDLLFDISVNYVERLQALVNEVQGERLPAAAHLRRLIARFMTEYEDSAARHRVLVQDEKYLSRAHRARVVARQRDVVAGFADAIARALSGRGRKLAPAAGDDPVRHDELDLHVAARRWHAESRGPRARRGGSLHRWPRARASAAAAGAACAAGAAARPIEPESERMSTPGRPKGESRARGARVVQ